jgi:hypothetical protein
MWNDGSDDKQDPDVYNGWRLINGDATNTTMKDLMTDTSGTWNISLDLGNFQVYRRNNRHGTF